MHESLPNVTVLIPARAEQSEVRSLAAAKALDYPADRLEILLARGNQPSAQRNEGIRTARGELVYFLDDDSIPHPQNLQRAVTQFNDARVLMLGGPNLCPDDAPVLEQVFALVLSAWLAFGPSRARYTRTGQLRQSGEKELILCNLLARRSALLELGGFNEALYPNEENALMDELQKRGGRLLYDPDFVVHRRPRHSLKAFSRMLMTYGRGRAEQFRLHPTFGSALNFVPPLFCLYVVSLALTPLLGILWLAPLAFYVLAVLLQGVQLAFHGRLGHALAATPLVALTHILYGIGFWRGLGTKLRPSLSKAPVQVRIERIQ